MNNAPKIIVADCLPGFHHPAFNLGLCIPDCPPGFHDAPGAYNVATGACVQDAQVPVAEVLTVPALSDFGLVLLIGLVLVFTRLK